MMNEKIKSHLTTLIVFAGVFYFMFGWEWGTDRSDFKPRFHDLPYSFKLTTYNGADWPEELADAQISEMRFYNNDLLLATKKGLVKIDFNRNETTRYQLHSDKPFEWWGGIDILDNKLVVSTLVANGSTGGTYAGNHALDLDTLIPTELEKHTKGQVFHNGLLYQLVDKKLLIKDPQLEFSIVQTIDLQKEVHKGCMFGAPLSTGNAIWVPTWGRATSSTTIYSFTKGKCGLIKIPDDGSSIEIIKKGNAMAYLTTQSSHSDMGGLLLVHPTRTQAVSYYDEAGNTWKNIDYSSLAGTLSDNYFWVGYRGVTGFARNASTNKSITVQTKPQQNRYVSSIAVRELDQSRAEVWVAFYVKNYANDSYSVISSLEKHIVTLP